MDIKITHINPEIQAFWEDLNNETDRGVAVLGHAYLDELLKKILKLRVVNYDKFIKIIDKRSTFKHRLILCYVTGTICKEVFEDLDKINWIRNEFAHNRKLKSFEDRQDIKNTCNKLNVIKWYKKRSIVHNETKTRDKYLLVISFLLTSLELNSKNLKAIKENRDYRRVFGS